MLRECYAGETMHLSADDLTKLINGVATDVTSGATVTIKLYRPDGTQEGGDLTGIASGNDWGVDVNMPATPLGTYTVKITATKDGAVGKGEGFIRMKGF